MAAGSTPATGEGEYCWVSDLVDLLCEDPFAAGKSRSNEKAEKEGLGPLMCIATVVEKKAVKGEDTIG
jgi:hypothetical protein